MRPQKSAFSYFVIILFLIAVLFALVCGISDMGVAREYPYVIRGAFFVLLLLLWLLLNSAAAVAARLELEDHMRSGSLISKVTEIVLVAVTLALAGWVRYLVLVNIPMRPASDYKTYYEIAGMLKDGTLTKDGAGYCDYIAMFPHVYGYPRVLATLFRFFGTSVSVAQNFNLILAVATVYVTYLTGRLAGGRLAGITALLLSAFWPSQVLYITQFAGEFLFSFLLMLSLYLFVLSVKICTADMRHPMLGVLLYIALGVTLGFCATVRPMALIVVITVFLCIFSQNLFIPAEKAEHQSISLMILSRGWLRCLIVLICYCMITGSTNLSIEHTIDRPLASGSASFGYNLLVGLNTSSEGGWNAEDAALLYDEYARTGNANQAHLACRDLAVQRLTRDPSSIFNLFLRKYHILWGNDDYGGTWNIVFLNEQGNLTPARESFLYASRDVGNLFYLLCVAFSGIAGIFLWRKGNDVEYAFILIFVGTVGMHLFVESQNRYHYHALFMFALLAGCAVNGIYRMNRAKVLKLREEKEAVEAQNREKQARIQKMHEDEAQLTQLREAAMQSKFDMRDALEKNLIHVSVSQVYDEGRRKDSADET